MSIITFYHSFKSPFSKIIRIIIFISTEHPCIILSWLQIDITSFSMIDCIFYFINFVLCSSYKIFSLFRCIYYLQRIKFYLWKVFNIFIIFITYILNCNNHQIWLLVIQQKLIDISFCYSLTILKINCLHTWAYLIRETVNIYFFKLYRILSKYCQMIILDMTIPWTNTVNRIITWWKSYRDIQCTLIDLKAYI